MTAIQAAIAIAAVGFFLWLLIMPSGDSRKTRASRRSRSEASSRPDQSADVGFGTGVMGGDFEDAAVTRYALSRTKKDPKSSEARDLGTALGQQSGFDGLDG